MNLTLVQLRMVVAVATEGSFTAAAEQALISQPALSRSIRDVERVLGVRLFERTTRSVALTPDGQEFVHVATEILKSADDGLGRFRAYRAGDRGSVTVAALPALAACVMPYVCKEFAVTRPQVRIRVLEGDTDTILRQVRDGRADIALTETPASPDGLRIRLLGDDCMVAIAAPGHPISSVEKIPWKEWACFPTVAFGPAHGLRTRADLACRQADATPQVCYEADDATTVVAMVSAGLGVAALTLSTLALASTESVHVVPLVAPEMVQSLAVVHRSAPALAPAAEAFVQSLSRVHFDPWQKQAPKLF